MKMKKNNLLVTFTVLLTVVFFFIVFASVNAVSPREITVKDGEPIVISVNVSNVGKKTQENWVVGIELYKVSDYTSFNTTKVAGSEIKINVKSSSYGCYDSDGIKIPDYDCVCSNNKYLLMGYFSPNDYLNVTCVLSSNLWSSKWGFTNGNERIMFRAMETEDDISVNEDLVAQWFVDYLRKVDPAYVLIKTIKGPKAELLNLENLNINCNQKGNFRITIRNSGSEDLNNLIIRDEIWTKPDGNYENTDPNCGPILYDSTQWSVPFLGVDQASTPQSWTMNKPLSSGMPCGIPSYYHIITIDYGGKLLFNSSRYLGFNCFRNEKHLKIRGIIDPTNKPLEHKNVIAIIKDNTGKTINWAPLLYEGWEVPLNPGTYSIEVDDNYPVVIGGQYVSRGFTHFADLNCDGTGNVLDTGDNPYVFSITSDKEIDAYYKGFTFINELGYNGNFISGKLLDEDGTVMSSFPMDPACTAQGNTYQNNVNVDLYYEKDNKWYPIGSAPYSSTDGYFSYHWNCIPGVKKLKAVYGPTWWSYYNSTVEIPLSCNLEMTEVKICKGTDCCPATCSAGSCIITNGCPRFDCGDNIEVYALLENKGNMDYKEVSVGLSLAEVKDNGGTSKSVPAGIIEMTDFNRGSKKTLSFSVPASEFAGMPDGHHIGLFFNLKGKLTDSYTIEFPTPGDDSTSPPPRLDNSKIYSIKKDPHLNFWCFPNCKVNELCNCTAIYTHDEDDSGEIQFIWDSSLASQVTSVGGTYTSCTPHSVIVDNVNYNIETCKVNNGNSFTIYFKPSKEGILNIYARARDDTKDDNSLGKCLYSLDSKPPSADDCDDLDNYFSSDLVKCNKNLVTIVIQKEEKKPDLVITDVFSYDGTLGYEIANQGSLAAFPSKTSLTIDDNPITSHTTGLLLEGSVTQYAFAGVNWKSYCNGPQDSVEITVRADSGESIKELSEDNYMTKQLPCCTKSSDVEICDNFVDDNCDGNVDCKDSQCKGVSTSLGTCCQDILDCSAQESDNGIVDSERGICTPYSCDLNNNVCKAQPVKIDNCKNGKTLVEYYASGYECLSNDINCPDDFYCYDGTCIPKEKSNEVCYDGIDNDLDSGQPGGGIDCADSDCYGKIGPFGLTCCGGTNENQYCSAADTDGGKDISNQGTCISYSCISNVCQPDLAHQKTDSCSADKKSLNEYYPDSNAPYSCKQEPITCSNGICEGGRCIECQGQVELNMIPSKTLPGPSGASAFYASGLSACNGQTIIFKEGSCSGTEKARCTIQADGHGCVKPFTAPSSPDTYTYFACTDKNGEASAQLEVTPGTTTACVYKLSLSPAEESSYNGIYSKTITATDSSTNCPTTTYDVQYSTEGDCNVNVNPSTFVGSSSFNLGIQMTGNRPCTVELRIVAPNGVWVAIGKYNVFKPEICNDGIDNDGNGFVDCTDEPACNGHTGPGMICCQSNSDCSAVDSDGGNDYYTKGVCTDYNCLGNGCAINKIYVDSCADNHILNEYTISGTSCSVDSYDCSGEGKICYDGKCITPPIQTASCDGDVTLTLVPSRTYPNTQVTPTVSGLRDCEGKTVHFMEGSCTGTEKGSCNIGLDGHGCNLPGIQAPGSTTTYSACLDKDEDSDFNDPGEQSSAALEIVIPPEPLYQLTITPDNGTEVLPGSHKIWYPDAIDRSEGVPPRTVIRYFIWFYPDGGCDVMTNITNRLHRDWPYIEIEQGQRVEQALNVTIVQKPLHLIGMPCRVLYKLYDILGHMLAHGEFKVCNYENTSTSKTPAACADGIDNDCDGLTDCADPDCAGYSGCCAVDSNCGGDLCTPPSPDNSNGGGICTQTHNYCDSGTRTCKSTTDTYVDSCGGDADNPSVTHYTCNAANQCEGSITTQSDSCTVNSGSCSSNDYDCEIQNNGAGMITSTPSSGSGASCVGTHSVRHYVCSATDGSVNDACVQEDTDCMAAGHCNCDNGACADCGEQESCNDYQCSSPSCVESCKQIIEPALGTCKSSCEYDEVYINSPELGYEAPKCTGSNPPKCCCKLSCDLSCPQMWCAFDSCGHPEDNNCVNVYPNSLTLFQNLLNRPPTNPNLYNPFSVEYYRVWCQNQRDVTIKMTPHYSPGNTGTFSLYTICESSGDWTSGTLCTGTPPECSCHVISIGSVTLFAVYNNSAYNNPATGTYDLSVSCSNPGGTSGMGVYTPVGPEVVSSTTIATITTTTPSPGYVQLSIIQIIRNLLGLR
jgi:hypothetical protein